MNGRKLWRRIHLVLGLTLGVLGVLIGITGSILVYDDGIDAWLNPQRYAVTGPQGSTTVSDYLKSAEEALAGEARPANIRFPDHDGLPVVVLARTRSESSGQSGATAAQGQGAAGTQGATPPDARPAGPGSLERLYLDPATARVLDRSSTGGFVGWVHSFHENLTLREYSGRQIVGFVGFGMLISSITGLYLWWPSRKQWSEAFRFRRGFTLPRNLHYVFGCYAAIVLGMLSFTGIFVAYNEGGRDAVALVARLSPNLNGPGAANTAVLRTASSQPSQQGAKREGANGENDAGHRRGIAPDDAVAAARALYPGAHVLGLALPAGAQGFYRVGMVDPNDSIVPPGGNISVFIDRASGTVLRKFDGSKRTAGDSFLAAQRPWHSGAPFGMIGRFIIAVVGFMPLLFTVTGLLMWLRRSPRAVFVS